MVLWRLNVRTCLIIALSVLFLGASTGDAAEKWALLIGVSDYLDDAMDLEGPSNDVQMLQELLMGKFGYAPDHMKILVDHKATRANIVGALQEWLIARARPEDTVLFYYSGHGSQIPDQNGDEKDGRDEVLCPADITRYISGKEITDDELGRMLQQIKARDVTVIVDACHAGTGTRAMAVASPTRELQVRTVQLEYPEPVGRERAMSFSEAETDGLDVLPSGEPTPGTRAVDEPSKFFTMVAACAPNETAASTVFSEGLSQFQAGVLTYNLISALRTADNRTTYADLMAGLVRDVKRINPGQTPQVEGNAERSIFSNSSGNQTGRNYIRVTGVNGKAVEMRSSSFGRDRPGSIYQVLSPETGKPSGRVRVTRTSGQDVEAEVIEGEGLISAPALAVEEYHALSTEKLHVRIGDFGNKQIAQAFRSRLEVFDFAYVVSDDAKYADQVVKGRVQGSVLSSLTGYEITAWLEEGGERSREVTSKSVDEIVKVLRPLLENAYAIKKLAGMDNSSPPFRVSVWATRLPDPGKKRAKFLEMKVGDPIYFHFRSEQDSYLTLLNVDVKGSITILYPNEYVPHNRVVAGKTYTIPTEEMGFQLRLGGPWGQELVKAFATKFPLDLSTLNSQRVGAFRALESDADESESGPSVVDRLASAMSGSLHNYMEEGTRAIVLSAIPQKPGPPPGTPTENWSTDYVIVQVR